jgi:hypothetical protein
MEVNMAYNWQQELEKVKKHYAGDRLQSRYSALITGETNAGKTYLLRTARLPIHIDSFDPGGTKPLRDMIAKGDVVVDTFFENEDPYNPKAFAEWKKRTELRLQIGYFEKFGTYCIDSLTTFSDAVMNYQLASRGMAGQMASFNIDYTPQKVEIENQIRRIMNLQTDFILTGHLERIVRLKGVDKKGIRDEEVTYRLMITGKAVMTIPLLFDELYVLRGKGTNPRREMLIDSLGEYVARSRFKGPDKLGYIVEPDIKEFLKKAGLEWEDKEKLQ